MDTFEPIFMQEVISHEASRQKRCLRESVHCEKREKDQYVNDPLVNRSLPSATPTF